MAHYPFPVRLVTNVRLAAVGHGGPVSRYDFLSLHWLVHQPKSPDPFPTFPASAPGGRIGGDACLPSGLLIRPPNPLIRELLSDLSALDRLAIGSPAPTRADGLAWHSAAHKQGLQRPTIFVHGSLTFQSCCGCCYYCAYVRSSLHSEQTPWVSTSSRRTTSSHSTQFV